MHHGCSSMNKIHVKLENCYGIPKFEREFDFSNFNIFVVYASNGIMKTSFAKTFRDIQVGTEPHDQLDKSLSSTYEVLLDGTGQQINSGSVCVIEPYNEKAFESGEKILTLLADEQTRKEYTDIYNKIEDLKKATLSSLKKISGSSNYEAEIIETFSSLGKPNIFEIFDETFGQVQSSKDSFAFKYNDVFDPNDKVRKFLEENSALLKQYIEKYDALISQSKFFSKAPGKIFGTTEAKNLTDSLDGDAFFVAGHKLTLKFDGDVTETVGLVKVVEDEVARIFSDKELKEVFDKIDKKLNANKELKAFKKVIENDPKILVRLEDYNQFRREVWFSFLKQIEKSLEELIALYNTERVNLEAVIKKAHEGRSEWEAVLEEFKNRFKDMPFTVAIRNKSDAVLKEEAPAIDFQYKGKAVEKEFLFKDVLSMGEKRALYLLDVIFEIKSRRLEGKDTLFVIDDIADSFDYKNKYAIVEYLNDLSKETGFRSIILTYNFDFFRTLQSRVLGASKWTHSLIAEKTDAEIKLYRAGDRNITDPFSTWRAGINNNEKCLVAALPFVRNLIEFRSGKCSKYLLLTHALHQKDAVATPAVKATKDICISDLEPVYADVLENVNFAYPDPSKKIVDIIDDLCKEIKDQQDLNSVVLEDKIVLAIGIRLVAERYMWSKISDKSEITKNQTGELFERYKGEFLAIKSHEFAIVTLERVNIMTPESIHLNSFMYEPILDMGIDELKHLRDDVLKLEV